jgi:hypothetical protein
MADGQKWLFPYSEAFKTPTTIETVDIILELVSIMARTEASVESGELEEQLVGTDMITVNSVTVTTATATVTATARPPNTRETSRA